MAVELLDEVWELRVCNRGSAQETYCAIVNAAGKVVFDTANSDVACVVNDDGHYLDEVGFANLQRVLRNERVFGIMMRRGWYPVCDSEKWWVDGEGAGILRSENVGPWSDPFTAIDESDRWFQLNVEKRIA